MQLPGELKIITGAALFALIPVCVLLGHEMSVYGLLFGRLLLGSIILFLLSKHKRFFFSITRKELLMLFGWSQLMLGAMIAYFFSIQYWLKNKIQKCSQKRKISFTTLFFSEK